jgi:hypothetical protein
MTEALRIDQKPAKDQGQLTQELERLRPLTLGELKNQPDRKMLVKGMLGLGEFSAVCGEPKCGKSFLATNLGLAIATGQDWFGRKVTQGPVLYVAAEGAGGFKKRIEAHRQHHGGIDEAPFHVILTSIDLLNPEADLQPLIYWAFTTKAKLVVIDTLSRTMPGGNENGPEDMGAYIANCDKIREGTGAHVLVVHHKPKGDKNTLRGHSSLFGAVDALILVAKTKDGNTVTIDASKDEKDGWSRKFSLKVIDVGLDEDGDAITSCAVIPGGDAPKNQKRLTGDKARALEALRDVLIRSGRKVEKRTGFPDGGAVCADVEVWRLEFYSRKDGEQEAKKKAFGRARDGLIDMGKVAYRDDLAWVVSHDDNEEALSKC